MEGLQPLDHTLQQCGELGFGFRGHAQELLDGGGLQLFRNAGIRHHRHRQHALAARAWARSRLREKEMAQIREELDYLSIGAEVHTTETGWVVWDFRILECPVRMMYSPGRQLLLTTTRVAPETPEEMKFLWQAIEICETDADDVGVRRWLEQKYGLQQFGVVVNLTTPNIIAAFSEAMTTLEKYCGAFFLQSFDDRDA